MAKTDIDALRASAEAAARAGDAALAARSWLAVGDRLAVRHKDAAVGAYRDAVRWALAGGRAADALAAADRAVEAAVGARWSHTHVDALRARASAREALGRRVDAVADLRAAVSATGKQYRDPARATARADLGVALWRLGLADDGRAELDAALKVAGQKQWMADLVATWRAQRDALEVAWAWATADGRGVGWWRGGGRVRVYAGGELAAEVADPGGDVVPVELAGSPGAVHLGPAGLARLVAEALSQGATTPTDVDTEGPGPESAPTVSE